MLVDHALSRAGRGLAGYLVVEGEENKDIFDAPPNENTAEGYWKPQAAIADIVSRAAPGNRGQGEVARERWTQAMARERAWSISAGLILAVRMPRSFMAAARPRWAARLVHM